MYSPIYFSLSLQYSTINYFYTVRCPLSAPLRHNLAARVSVRASLETPDGPVAPDLTTELLVPDNTAPLAFAPPRTGLHLHRPCQAKPRQRSAVITPAQSDL